MRYPHAEPSFEAPRPEDQDGDGTGLRLSQDFEGTAFRFFRQFNGDPPKLSLNDFLVRFERAVVFKTLAEMNGCQRRAAAFLKLKNSTLNRKVKIQHIHFAKIPVMIASDGPTGSGSGHGT